MMDTNMQKRLDILFEMETIKSPLMPYIAPGVSLKIIVDLGAKDQNGNKKRFYEETRYRSNKYKNTEYLVSANFRLNSYLLLEYPNSQYSEDPQAMKTKVIFIKAYAIDDMIEKIKEFNHNFAKCFGIKNKKLYIKSDLSKEITVYPSLNSSISFKPDIYETNLSDRTEMGVRLTFNNEYSIIISAETTWPEFVYKMTRCDLTLIGFQIIQSYMSLLPGMAVSEIGSEYSSTSKYSPYWEDPDDIINRPESIKISNSSIQNSFFSNL